MKKCTFFRIVIDRIEDGIRTVKTDGYCETLIDKTGNKITICFYKTSSPYWYAVEKSYGCLICSGSTRKEVLKIIKEKYIDELYELMVKNYPSLRSMISKSYEDGKEIYYNYNEAFL